MQGNQFLGVHGHSYEIEIIVEGAIRSESGQSDNGMIMNCVPTAENLAHIAFKRIKTALAAARPTQAIRLVRIRLSEGPTSWAEISEPEPTCAV